jgi:hypothetical protein
MGWATVWAIFSQTHLVTLVARPIATFPTLMFVALCMYVGMAAIVCSSRRYRFEAGLPDGIFSNQSSQFG